MADNTSWFPGIGLLSESSLSGLDESTQKQLQSEATKRFVLGGLLSGRPDIAFQSAVGVPTDYFARQNAIQAQQQQQQLLGARNASYERVGLPYVQGSEQEKMLAQDIQDFGPDAARTYAALESNRNLPKKFNQEKFAGLASEILAGTDPKGWAEFNKNIRPYSQEGNTYQMSPFTNKPIGFMPGMEKGEEPVYNSRGEVVGVRNVEGKISAISERAVAEQGAQAMFGVEQVAIPGGGTGLARKSDIIGYTTPGSFTPNQPSAVAPKSPKPVVKPAAPQAGNRPQVPGFVQGVDIANTQNPLVAAIKEEAPPEIAYQKGWEKINEDAQKKATAASDRSANLQVIRQLVNKPDFYTGALSNYKKQLLSFASSAGIATEKQKDFVNTFTGLTQQLNGLGAQAVTDLSGSTSNFDLQFSLDRFAKPTDMRDANNFAVDFLEAADKRKMEYAKFVRENRTGDADIKWRESEQGKASIYDSKTMSKYLPVVGTVKEGPYQGQKVYLLPNWQQKIYP